MFSWVDTPIQNSKTQLKKAVTIAEIYFAKINKFNKKKFLFSNIRRKNTGCDLDFYLSNIDAPNACLGYKTQAFESNSQVIN